ncbi:MAG TPA: bifunctional glycosyltransferase/class I SAM-dependent methyltransferase [Ignavibacteria bacterium]
MKNGKKIGILIVAYNAVTTLTKVLDRIPKNVYEEIDEIAVFDDASKDDTYMLSLGYKEVHKLEKLYIYLNDKNLGYGGNQKQGFSYFIEKDFDIVVLLHGDGQYAPEILSEMYTPIVDGKSEVVLGSRMMNKYGGALKGGMPFYKYLGNRILSIYENYSLKMDLTEFHSGYRAYSIDGLKKIKLDNCSNDFHFDTQIIIKANHNNLRIAEIPIPTYYGDEICYVNGMRYARNIYKTVREYKKTISGKLNSPVYSEYYINYPLKLYPHSSHYIALKELKSKNNLKILDIGCGEGFFASNISNSNLKTGVDFISENDNIRNNFNNYYQYNLNDGIPLELQGHKFDFVLCLDILEHLTDYETILMQVKNILKDDGNLIISLPNIANIYIRLNLLFGRFPYSDRGILDRTHLHFFTLGSIKKLLRKYDFELIKVRVSPIPVIEVLPVILKKNIGKILNQFLFLFSFIFKRLFGYQFIITCKKNKSSLWQK